MKLIIDAQLPRRLCHVLRELGHDVVHTLDLPNKNKTKDQEIILLARKESRIVMTKDSDFVDSFILRGEPERLWLVSTGNIKNEDLQTLIVNNVASVELLFEQARFVEINQEALLTRA
jgi:predicted nuclease of predicted toxin-antitoxin system